MKQPAGCSFSFFTSFPLSFFRTIYISYVIDSADFLAALSSFVLHGIRSIRIFLAASRYNKLPLMVGRLEWPPAATLLLHYIPPHRPPCLCSFLLLLLPACLLFVLVFRRAHLNYIHATQSAEWSSAPSSAAANTSVFVTTTSPASVCDGKLRIFADGSFDYLTE